MEWLLLGLAIGLLFVVSGHTARAQKELAEANVAAMAHLQEALVAIMEHQAQLEHRIRALEMEDHANVH